MIKHTETKAIYENCNFYEFCSFCNFNSYVPYLTDKHIQEVYVQDREMSRSNEKYYITKCLQL